MTYEIGRVFFLEEKDGPSNIPQKVRIIPLDCHVSNVHRLAEHWAESPQIKDFQRQESSLWSETREQVLSAALHHDDAKPLCFRITYEDSSRRKGFGYSFAGHRFKVPPKEPYTDSLIRGHHDFSVGDIVEATYRLRATLRESKTPEALSDSLLAQNPQDLVQRYRDDLYILEMCDQIEASLESILIGWDGSEPRNFMDFSIFSLEELGLSQNQHKTSQLPKETNTHQLTLFEQGTTQIPPPSHEHSIHYLEPCCWDTDRHGPQLLMTCQYQELDVPLQLQTMLQQLLEKKEDKKAAKALQDWLLRNTDRDALQTQTTELHPFPAKRSTPGIEKVPQILGFPKLNPMQQEVRDRMLDQDAEGVGLLLRAPTGSGKTEAILWPCLEQGRRLIMALSTRSLLDDHAQRVRLLLSRAAKETGRIYTLIIDTGSKTKQELFTPDGPKAGKRRHLYRADVILTTLDKFIYRYFGYSDKTKSMVFPHRIAQSNTILCFDEAHSYDGLAWTNFRMLVQNLYQTGQEIVLMTATMPPQLLRSFPDLDLVDYCDGEKQAELLSFMRSNRPETTPWHPEKRLRWVPVPFEFDGDSDSFEYEQAYESALAKELTVEALGALKAGKQKIILITNTVSTAIEIFQKLREELQENPQAHELILYHGRLAAERWFQPSSGDKSRRSRVENPREQRYAALKERDQHDRPYLLVTTHAIEVGCDLDADLLLTAFCNPDSLIQRAGRCNRKNQLADAALVVVGAHIPSYLQFMSEETQSTYLQELQTTSGALFDAEALSPFLLKEDVEEDPRLIELFEMLHEYVYHGEILNEPVHKRGLIATRSWEPSVTVRYKYKNYTDEVSVPISRLRLRKIDEVVEKVAPELVVLEKRYDPDKGQYGEESLTRGDAYAKREIIVELTPQEWIVGEDFTDAESEHYDELLGLHNIPRVFEVWQQRSNLKMMARDQSEKGAKSIIHYLAPFESED